MPQLPPMDQIIPPVFGYALFQIASAISRLGVPDALGEAARPADELAEELGADRRFLHRLLRAGTAAGLLRSEDGERFSLTPLGALYRSDSPWQGSAHDAYHAHTAVWNAWGGLEGAVRSGTPAFHLVHGRGLFSHLEDDPALARLFHTTMATGTALQVSPIVDGFDFSRFQHVTDIGGGDGTNLAAILNAHPGVRGTVFDLAPAIRDVPAVLDKAGVADRCDSVAGDFMESVPPGADLYLLKSVVHDWDDANVHQLLSNCRAAMGPSSRLVMFTWLMPDGEIRAEPAEELAMAIQDIELMVVTRGEIRTLGAYTSLFAGAGLRITGVTEIPCPFRLHAVEAEPI